MKKSSIRRRGKSRFPKRREPTFLAWIREQPCCICGDYAEPSHITSRGAGGYDVGNVVPMCHQHHQEFHDWGIWSFQERWKVSLRDMAMQYAALYDTKCISEGLECPQNDDQGDGVVG